MRRRLQRGFTIVELMVAFVLLLILSSLALPTFRWEEKRRREAHLKVELAMMRHAIDQYKKYSDEGLIIQTDVEHRADLLVPPEPLEVAGHSVHPRAQLERAVPVALEQELEGLVPGRALRTGEPRLELGDAR